VANQPLLSVIITSYTAERLNDVFELLDSIKGQTYTNIEVIFVAERSKELYEKVKDYGEKIGLPGFKVLFNYGEPGLSQARNLGIKHANGQIIAFVDDDVVLSSCWAKELVRTFMLDDDIIGITGPALPLWEDKSMDWFPEEFHWVISCTSWTSFNEVTDIRNVWGHNFSFRKEAFSLCGLFNTKYGFPKGTYEGFLGEDNEFSMRVKAVTKKRIVYNHRVLVRHKVHKYRLRWRVIIRRSYWMGYSRQILRRQYKTSASENLLNLEQRLLKNVFAHFVPTALKNLLRQPSKSLRRLLVATISLICISLGYAIGYFTPSYQQL
jgi:glycosyltransferase involved in cell wall biosynthesis